jgi:hypothetical protein
VVGDTVSVGVLKGTAVFETMGLLVAVSVGDEIHTVRIWESVAETPMLDRDVETVIE